MRASEILQFNGDTREAADGIARHVHAIIRVARMALENETSGDFQHREAYVADALEIAECLMDIVSDGVEGLARETKRGTWRRFYGEDAA
ncbi:hypothetical protein [Paracoccus aminophilus]|uniref:Uncharacterized protein n=1 Tax=Paracoccus aminophilus JCM 7686 TaxID=1367847 RepID=S5XXH3_PARAH|nr:hypothetical protein [Paracoccus aminophilus]AGT08130.1 hypothetical protein JCM7686_1021 [Paracoccus aminophilus JCM 7686]